ncbi:MAG TPA: hypothetical protein VIT22_11635 [Pseudoxanthomonas sp.]
MPVFAGTLGGIPECAPRGLDLGQLQEILSDPHPAFVNKPRHSRAVLSRDHELRRVQGRDLRGLKILSELTGGAILDFARPVRGIELELLNSLEALARLKRAIKQHVSRSLDFLRKKVGAVNGDGALGFKLFCDPGDQPVSSPDSTPATRKFYG